MWRFQSELKINQEKFTIDFQKVNIANVHVTRARTRGYDRAIFSRDSQSITWVQNREITLNISLIAPVWYKGVRLIILDNLYNTLRFLDKNQGKNTLFSILFLYKESD
tara:strand:+ start:65 stop:388 length:324 start_codon:yes stop_codon:yes gene_type:complete